ncbi:acid-resistance membrane protein [Pirellulimonas nuda]|uniref:Acid-resistance membrane protein n=1 Tax=Pirellulimonas nuda TaxID=2528009 RepID=A0A518DFZ3_9BACT|nr:HdeD family acid-resistance protein [Pirellulimonas nuda]QDU90352.1 acid-resistance membrane protein [Pirellulimonas nuda]
MDNPRPIAAPGVLATELALLRDYWGWFLGLGLAMVATGAFVLGWSCITTVTFDITWLFGFLLLASGIGEIIGSFWVGRWSGMLIHLLIGVLYALVGMMIIDQPESAAIQLTLIIAVFLMVAGIFRIVFAISEQFPGRGWVLLNGGVTFLLGLVIYKQWPASGLWVIGLFIGIDLVFNGWAWVMLAVGLRTSRIGRAPRTVLEA